MPGKVQTNRVGGLDQTQADHLHGMQEAEGVSQSAQRPGQEPAELSYYDISILRRPVWKWEIAGYFFFGGLSSGAYLLARLAERLGDRENEHRELVRTGALVAFIASLPNAPLLIKDLGDPKRFHHMLRVWKPTTPMNLGAWVLTAYSGVAAVTALREYLRDREAADQAGQDRSSSTAGRLAGATLLALHDAAGVPLALFMMGYGGVLLSCTANPLWCRNPWLGPLFSASAVSNGAEAISLVMDVRGRGGEAAQEALDRIDKLAHVAEAGALVGYLQHAGEQARPITRGKWSPCLWLGAGGLVASEVVKALPVRSREAKRWTRLAGTALGLAAGLALRWGLVYAGQDAADDPHLARKVTGSRKAEK